MAGCSDVSVLSFWFLPRFAPALAVTTFVHSAFLSHDHKLDMVHVQNSTLAGGVAVGAICNLLIGPAGAIGVGIVAGAISVLGYRYVSVSGLIAGPTGRCMRNMRVSLGRPM